MPALVRSVAARSRQLLQCRRAMATKIQGLEREEMLRSMQEMEAKLDKEIAANVATIKAYTSHDHGFLNCALNYFGVPKGAYREERVGNFNLFAMFCASAAVASWFTGNAINISSENKHTSVLKTP